MTRYVLDASVVAKWHFAEHLSERALVFLEAAREGRCELSAPELVVYEFGSIVLKKARAQQVRPDDAGLLLQGFPRAPLRLVPLGGPFVSALTIGLSARASFYDAVYIATAQAIPATLVTADDELIGAVRGTPWESGVVALCEAEP